MPHNLVAAVPSMQEQQQCFCQLKCPTGRYQIGGLWCCRYKLNIWDVGGQKTLRPYWRNYYEKTDGLIWVVDSADLARLDDCKKELHSLLQEERLFGATLLILANKQDIPAALSLQEIEQVCVCAAEWITQKSVGII